jgi:hypothetical protein
VCVEDPVDSLPVDDGVARVHTSDREADADVELAEAEGVTASRELDRVAAATRVHSGHGVPQRAERGRAGAIDAVGSGRRGERCGQGSTRQQGQSQHDCEQQRPRAQGNGEMDWSATPQGQHQWRSYAQEAVSRNPKPSPDARMDE